MSNKRSRPNFENEERNLSLYNDIEPQRVIQHIMNRGIIEGDVYDYCILKKHKLLSLLNENDELFKELMNTDDFKLKFNWYNKNEGIYFGFGLDIFLNSKKMVDITFSLTNQILQDMKNDINENGDNFLSGISGFFDDNKKGPIKFGPCCFTITNKIISIEHYIDNEEYGEDIVDCTIQITKINSTTLASEFRKLFEFIMSS